MIGLRSLAHSDLADIIRDPYAGTATVLVKSPTGATAEMSGWVNDIFLSLDPVSQSVISGRQASVSFLISDLKNAGFEALKGVAESTKKPWLVTFDDVNGVTHTFKVSQANPDHSAGLTVCFLENYAS